MASPSARPSMGRRTRGAVAALCLTALYAGSPSPTLALTQDLSRLEQRPVASPGDAADAAAYDARKAELRSSCDADAFEAFVNLLAETPGLQLQQTAPFIRRIDDDYDVSVPSGYYADFPLEALDWNLIRRGSQSPPDRPGYLLIRTFPQADGGHHVFWFDAHYEGEPLGDAPGTLVAATGPRGLLVFEPPADGCWILTQDIRGGRALSEFFDGTHAGPYGAEDGGAEGGRSRTPGAPRA